MQKIFPITHASSDRKSERLVAKADWSSPACDWSRSQNVIQSSVTRNFMRIPSEENTSITKSSRDTLEWINTYSILTCMHHVLSSVRNDRGTTYICRTACNDIFIPRSVPFVERGRDTRTIGDHKSWPASRNDQIMVDPTRSTE